MSADAHMPDIFDAMNARLDAQEAHQRAQDDRQTAPPAEVASVPTVDAAAVLASHWVANVTPPEDGVKGCPPAFVCMECGQPWLGDAETGGCEAVLLAKENILLREALEQCRKVVK